MGPPHEPMCPIIQPLPRSIWPCGGFINPMLTLHHLNPLNTKNRLNNPSKIAELLCLCAATACRKSPAFFLFGESVRAWLEKWHVYQEEMEETCFFCFLTRGWTGINCHAEASSNYVLLLVYGNHEEINPLNQKHSRQTKNIAYIWLLKKTNVYHCWGKIYRTQ